MKIKCTKCNNSFDFVDHDGVLGDEVASRVFDYNRQMTIPRGAYCPHCKQYVLFTLKVMYTTNEDAIMLTSAQLSEIKSHSFDYGFSAGVRKGYTEAADNEYDSGYENGLADYQAKLAEVEEEGQELYKSGVEEGYENGHREGYTEGYDMGYDDGYIDCKAGRPRQN